MGFGGVGGGEDFHGFLAEPIEAFGILAGQDNRGGGEAVFEAVVSGAEFALAGAGPGGLARVGPVGSELARSHGFRFRSLGIHGPLPLSG